MVKEDQLCDQFIFGLADHEFKQRLCLLDDLSLSKVVTAARQSEVGEEGAEYSFQKRISKY